MASEFPVYLALGPHAGEQENTPALENFRDDISLALNSANGGAVAVLMEYVNHSREAGLQIQNEVEAGERPSVAIVNNQRIYNKKRHSPEIYQKLLETDFADSFTRGYRGILDGAFASYPERLILLPEWAPEEQINQNRRSGIAVRTHYLRYLLNEGRDEEVFSAFKDLAIYTGNASQVRERRVAETLLELVQQRPDVKAAVGYFGTFHTGLSKEFRDLGFAPKRNLSEKIRLSKFSINAIARYVRFFPERTIPESYWETAYQWYCNGFRLRKSHQRGLPMST